MRAAKEGRSMRGSLNSTMRESLVARISKLIAGHRELSISPDVLTSGQPACGLLLSDPSLGDIRRVIRSLRLSASVCGESSNERSGRTSILSEAIVRLEQAKPCFAIEKELESWVSSRKH